MASAYCATEVEIWGTKEEVEALIKVVDEYVSIYDIENWDETICDFENANDNHVHIEADGPYGHFYRLRFFLLPLLSKDMAAIAKKATFSFFMSGWNAHDGDESVNAEYKDGKLRVYIGRYVYEF